VADAVEPQTQQARLRMARLVQTAILDNPEWQGTTMALASAEAMLRIHHRLKWSASTLNTAVGHFASFMKNLDVYANAFPVVLGKMGFWNQLNRKITKDRNLADVRQARPLTLAAFERMMDKFILNKEHGAAFLLLVGWSHAARVGNVATLMKKNFEDADLESITWSKAKTTARIGKYTTASSYGNYTQFLQDHMKDKKPTELLCSTYDLDKLRTALKVEDNSHDLRSLRRGALQTLAKSGTDVPTLLHFSGHTSEKSLMRYLGWGAKFSKGIQNAKGAAKAALVPSSTRMKSESPTRTNAIAI
jgi:hypothetical protein